MVIFGVIVLVTVILLPGGIMEAIDRISPSIRHKFKKRRELEPIHRWQAANRIVS